MKLISKLFNKKITKTIKPVIETEDVVLKHLKPSDNFLPDMIRRRYLDFL